MTSIVRRYDEAERHGLQTLSNGAIQAFRTTAFDAVAYPVRVFSDTELWRYHDVMQENTFESNLELLEACSTHEVDELRWLASSLSDFSGRYFGWQSSGRDAATRALLQLRLVQMVSGGKANARVLELGPGSGYLSLLMAHAGFRVFTVEPAQAFCCYQAMCSWHILGSKFVSFLSPGDSASSTATTCLEQIPWWVFANQDLPLLEVDVITVNHALAEFSPTALRYLFQRYGPEYYSNSGRSPIICAESLGSRVVNSTARTLDRVLRCGWTFERRPKGSYIFRFDPIGAKRQLTDIQTKRRVTQLSPHLMLRVTRLAGRLRLVNSWFRETQATASRTETRLDEIRALFNQIDNGGETPNRRFYRLFSHDSS